jgi:CDGSH-type Zn-finger protein
MRLSEVLALRWRWVDLDMAVISVREALEPTKVHGIRPRLFGRARIAPRETLRSYYQTAGPGCACSGSEKAWEITPFCDGHHSAQKMFA